MKAQSKKAPAHKTTHRKLDADSATLARYEKHRDMAEKHRAKADLIEAKLRVAGKEIRHRYPGDRPPDAVPKAKVVIVKRRD